MPGIEEGIKWNMLHYEEDGDLFALAAQKNYVSLYVMATQALEDKAESLKNVSHGKGCLRFKKLADIPDKAIKELLTHAQQVRERACKKQAATL